MKKYLGCFLMLFVLQAGAQNKVKLELVLNIAGISNTSPAKENPTRLFLFSPDTTISTFPGMWGAAKREMLPYKPKIRPGASIGGRATFGINNFLSVQAGVAVAFFTAARSITYPAINRTFTDTFRLYGTSSTGGPVTLVYPPGTYNFNPELTVVERYRFVNVNTTLGIQLRKKKWGLELGVTPSLIIASKRVEEEYNAAARAEITNYHYFNNLKKLVFSLNVGPTYSISDHLSAGLIYSHGVTGVIDDATNAPMKLRSLGLNFAYHF